MAERRGRGLRFALYALVPPIALLALLEIGLRALDVGSGAPLSLTRGFDDGAAYLRPDPDVPGGWRTQLFGDEMAHHEFSIPPKGSRLRVILLGGSNTQAFPSGQLQKRLTAAYGPPAWEVINLGRAGYGSERVRILFEQAMVLEPDLVVVYSGHNEFLEAGYAMELLEQWRSPWLMKGADFLARLRTVSVLADALRLSGAERVAFDQLPKERQARDDRFSDFTWDDTRVFHDAYRDNMRRICATATDGGARVLLCTVVSNALSPPFVSNLPPALSDADVMDVRNRVGRVWTIVPREYVRGLFPPIRLSPVDWGQASPEEQARRRAASAAAGREPPRLRPLLGALAERSAQGTLWRDPALWTDAVHELLGTIAAIHERDVTEQQRERIELALASLDEVTALVPDHPNTLFERALCTYLLGGDDARAVELFDAAAAADRAPRKGTTITNGIVREVAAEFADRGVVLLDADALFRARTPDGLVGYELMSDVCHLHPGCADVLMDDVVEAVTALASPRR